MGTTDNLKASVIDLGFNSLKLVAYEVKRDNSFVAYNQKSIPARLGEGLSQTGFLGNEQIRRTIDGLKYLREMNDLYSVRHCLPIATSAVREAANKEQFLQQAQRETGFRFRILSGKEEALYSYSGASRSIGEPDMLFFDIGGGSLEFVYAIDFKPKKILSLPLGGLRLTQLYADSDGAFKEKALSKMEERIWDLLPSKNEILLKGKVTLVGVGGNLRGLARWDQKIRNYPFNKIHNYSLKRDSIQFMREELVNLTTKEVGEIDVIGKDRAETIAAGSLVIELLMKKLGFQKLTVSTHGLRDGVLASFLEDPVGYHKGSIRISRSRRRTKIVPPVAKALESYGLIDKKEKEMLAFGFKFATSELAASRPESFFYALMDEDSELSHKDQLIVALALVQQRKQRSADWLYSKYRSMLKPKNKNSFSKLAVIINFLEILDRTESQAKISLMDRGSRIKIRIASRRKETPQLLLRDSILELSEELDRFIDFSVRGIPKDAEQLSQRKAIVDWGRK
ncbi:MAG: Ppx/GppA phosphatase family protein [Nitrososphaerales archaeon]